MEPILLVDDDPTARACLREILELKGFQCLEADQGAAALEVLKRESVSAIVTDCQMPVMDGLALIEHLHNERTADQIPIILVTGELTAEVRARAVNAGVTTFFQKPFDFHTLVLEITRATRHRHSLSMV